MIGSRDPEGTKFRICFVCTGNICRSPMAEIIFKQLAMEEGLADRFHIMSAGTGDWHVGEPADPRTVSALAKQGLDGSKHRAKQFESVDFDRFDLVIAFDRGHLRVLNHRSRTDDELAKIRLLLSFDSEYDGDGDVKDPYYSEDPFFDEVLQTIDQACRSLFQQIKPAVISLS